METTPTFSRNSTAQAVSAHIRAMIGAGELCPGEWIREEPLAKSLGVSRAPVREALSSLAQQGLVSIRPYRGARVVELSADRLRQLLDFRIMLEELAVRRAIQRGTDTQWNEFEALIRDVARSAQANDFEGAVTADFRLHSFLIDLADNVFLREAFGSVGNEMQLYIRLTSRHYERIDELAREHMSLLDALRSRRIGEACNIISAHILHGYERALEELKK